MLRQANRALDQQNDLAANRAYYAMFHAATALLLSERLAYSRQVIGGFGERFVKTGRFPRDVGMSLTAAFELRNKADYEYGASVTADEASNAVAGAEAFVAEAERLLQS